MPIGVNDTVRVSANFVLPGPVLYQNIYHYNFDGVGTPADAVVVTAVEDQMQLMYDELEVLVRNDILADLSSVDQVDFVDGQWQVIDNLGTFTISLQGIAAGEALPYQSSPFVTFKTARPKTVGRKFLFPIAENFQNATVLTGAAVTALVAYADEVLADITIEVINALVPGVIRTGVNEFRTFTVGVVTNLLGSQRRRRPGEGA